MGSDNNIADTINEAIISINNGLYQHYFMPLSMGKTATRAIVEAAMSDLEFILLFGEQSLHGDIKTRSRINAFRDILVQLGEIPPETLRQYPEFAASLRNLTSEDRGYGAYPPWQGYENVLKLIPRKFGLIGAMEKLKAMEPKTTEADKLVELGQSYLKLLAVDYPDVQSIGQKPS